jgi:hypothetical protein
LGIFLSILILLGYFYISKIKYFAPVEISVKNNLDIKVVAKTVFGKELEIQQYKNSNNFKINKGYIKSLQILCNAKLSESDIKIKIQGKEISDFKLNKDNSIVIKNDISFLDKLIKVLIININILVLLAFLVLLIYMLISKQNQIFYEKFNQIVFLLIIICGFATLLFAAFYSYPNAEDLSFGVSVKQKGIFESTTSLIINYDSRYATNFLYMISPVSILGVYAYKMVPVFLLLLTFLSSYFFVSQIYSGKRKNLFLFSAFFIVMYFASVPSIYKALYWMSSSYVYTFAWIINLLWIALLLKMFKEKEIHKKIILFILFVLIYFVSFGVNELNIIFNTIVISFVVFYIFKFKKHLRFEIIPVIILSVLFVAFVFSLPGILNRIEDANYKFNISANLNFVFLTKITIEYFKGVKLILIQNPYVLLLPFITINLVKKFDFYDLNRVRTSHILLLLIFVFLVSYILYFSFRFFVASDKMPLRLLGFIWFPILLTFMLATSVLIEKNNFASSLFLKQKTHSISLLLVLISIFFINGNNYYKIIDEYMSGQYSIHKQNIEKRYKIFQDAAKQKPGERVAIIDYYENYPKTVFGEPDLFPYDLQSDMQPMWRRKYCMYFGVDKIIFKDEIFSIQERIKLDLQTELLKQ